MGEGGLLLKINLNLHEQFLSIYIYINININLGQLILGKIAISFHEIDCKSGGSIMEVELSTERYEQTILLKYSWK